MTVQQMFERMMDINKEMSAMIEEYLNSKYTDAQRAVPREVEFDFLNFQDSFRKLHAHGKDES